MSQSPALCGKSFWTPNVPQPPSSSNSISLLAHISTVQLRGQTPGMKSIYDNMIYDI